MFHTTDDESCVRVLIVEDDRDTAESMARLLGIFGFVVEEARDGVEAIALATRRMPDFVLLDIGLPGMDGYQVARYLKQMATCQQTTLIAVTGYSKAEDRERSRHAGIDHHLVKPIDYEVLLDLLVQDQTSAPPMGPPRSGP
jgi:CheY-like chemotaxis protein